MKKHKNIELIGADERTFLMDLYEADNAEDIVIFCHGFKGFKDWGAWHLVAEYFASEACHFVKFNFSHNGTTVDNPYDFDDLDAFGRNTYSKELFDLDSVLRWLQTEKIQGRISYKNIHLIGHSRSGPIVIIGGLNNQEVASVTTWAGVPNLDYAFRPNFLEEWKKNGVRYIFNGRTNQQMPLGYGVLEDYYANEQKLDLVLAANNAINNPRMHFIHGDKDRAIPHEAINQLMTIFPNSKSTLIKNTGHTFRSTHPWDSQEMPKSLSLVCQVTLNSL